MQSAQKRCKHSFVVMVFFNISKQTGHVNSLCRLEVKPQFLSYLLLPPEVFILIHIKCVPMFCLMAEFCLSAQPKMLRLLPQPGAPLAAAGARLGYKPLRLPVLMHTKASLSFCNGTLPQ